jgi:hypothetical protein
MAVTDRQFEIEFLDPNAEAFAFGWSALYLNVRGPITDASSPALSCLQAFSRKKEGAVT